jgi:hypothetical protein
MWIASRLFLAAAALLMAVLLLVAGPVAAQDAAVEGVAPPAEEIAANARAKEAAVLAAELVQLRAKISALGACTLTLPDSGSASSCSAASSVGFS